MHTDIYAYNHTRTNNFIQTYNTLTKNKHIKIRTKKKFLQIGSHYLKFFKRSEIYGVLHFYYSI